MPKKLVEEEKGKLENQFQFSVPGIVSTDIALLDWAFGSGLPLGRQIDLSGLPGVGKSSFALYMGSRFLKHYPSRVFYFESEGKPPLADHVVQTLGYKDLTQITTRRPNNIIELLDELELVMSEVDTGCIIVDSLTSFGADRGKEGTKDYVKMSDHPQVAQVAAKNDMFSKGSFFKTLPNKQVMFLVVNQLRDNIGNRFGGQHIPGGMAMRFSSSMNIRLSKEQGWKIEDSNKNIIGQNVTFYVEKNMIGAPFREVTIPFYWQYGFDGEEGVLMLAYEKGIVTQSAGWYVYGDRPKMRKGDFVNAMRSDRGLNQEILEKLLKVLG